MLTESEREWVKYRQIFNGYYPYGCLTCSLQRTLCDKTDCLLHPDLGDAAEFSERVSAKLARWDNEYHKGDHLCPYGDDDLDSYIPLCHCINFCQDHPKLGCIAAKLAWVRLSVEEEMDADMDK